MELVRECIYIYIYSRVSKVEREKKREREEKCEASTIPCPGLDFIQTVRYEN